MPILIVQQQFDNPPGRLGEVFMQMLPEPPEVLRVWQSAEMPKSITKYDGLVLLGGTPNVDQLAQLPWMQREFEYVQEAHARSIPTVGICLGSQVIADALGGTVGRLSDSQTEDVEVEFGWHEVERTSAGHQDSLAKTLPPTFWQFHSHACHVIDLPSGCEVLASSEICPVQMFKASPVMYGIQFHFEMDRDYILKSANDAADPLGTINMPLGEFRQSCDEHYEAYDALSTTFCRSLACHLFL